ncbi:RNA-directed DNA polymerase, eukaryota [Tanacetum coccineum]
MDVARPYLSKEDLTQWISKSVFVTNFPDHCTARDLWNVCTAYGKVADVYIPLKKSKADKKFAFVRFLNVDNFEHLIENIGTIWMGRFRLHANPVRFQREPRAQKFSTPPKENVGPVKHSFASVLKSNNVETPVSSPAIVMDDSCLVESDSSCSLMGKIKDINALSNLYIILADEGFDNFTLSYLGGFWVHIDAGSVTSKEKMLNHVGVASWFSELHHANDYFVSEDRLVWISIEGLPKVTWNNTALAKIVSQWGSLSDVEEASDATVPFKKVCVVTKPSTIINDSSSSDEDSVEDDETDHVLESSCMKQQGESENQSNVSKQGITSADPFGIYDILNRNNDQVKVSKDMSSEEQTFPPSFTPTSVKDKAGDDFPNSDQHKSSFHRNSEGVSVEQNGNIRPIKIKSGGSILEVMEDLVKIGQTMGYNMEGFGFSSEILCIWDTSKFVKDNVTISDSFLAIRGTWILSSTKLLIVVVYAPQDFSERKILWDYIDHIIQLWEGECVILGDFNEVRF